MALGPGEPDALAGPARAAEPGCALAAEPVHAGAGDGGLGGAPSLAFWLLCPPLRRLAGGADPRTLKYKYLYLLFIWVSVSAVLL